MKKCLLVVFGLVVFCATTTAVAHQGTVFSRMGVESSGVGWVKLSYRHFIKWNPCDGLEYSCKFYNTDLPRHDVDGVYGRTAKYHTYQYVWFWQWVWLENDDEWSEDPQHWGSYTVDTGRRHWLEQDEGISNFNCNEHVGWIKFIQFDAMDDPPCTTHRVFYF